ncbi:MAG: hypothetical protein J3Q66DRAFT_83458 [Benniella sp.]|nr:MAG: hypothetical protein J3Q66DRAFT_83458 [Benniella sp.]
MVMNVLLLCCFYRWSLHCPLPPLLPPPLLLPSPPPSPSAQRGCHQISSPLPSGSYPWEEPHPKSEKKTPSLTLPSSPAPFIHTPKILPTQRYSQTFTPQPLAKPRSGCTHGSTWYKQNWFYGERRKTDLGCSRKPDDLLGGEREWGDDEGGEGEI